MTIGSPVHSVSLIRRYLLLRFRRLPTGLGSIDDLVGTAYFLLPFMLLGFLLWQIGVLERSWEHRRFFAYLLVIGGGIGLASSLVAQSLNHRNSLLSYGLAEPLTPWLEVVRGTCLEFARPGLVLAYIALIALLMSMRWPARFLKAIAPAGRMAFTVYVLHHMLPPVLFPLLFGWWLPDPAGPVQMILKVTIVFAMLVVFSTWWLNRYRFGPFEWLWRSLTYWKLQPMRVERSGSVLPIP